MTDLRFVCRMLVKDPRFTAAAGLTLAIGLFGVLASARLLASQLFGVTPTDPLTLTGVSLGLATVAFVACDLPACQATKIDPMLALRAG